MVPRSRADECLHDQTLHINQGSNLCSIFAWQVGQQPLQVEVHIALVRLSLQTVLIGHREVAQAVHHVCEYVKGNEAIVQQLLLTRGPHGSHLFASLEWHADIGCSLEAIDITICYITQEGSSQGHTVGVATNCDKLCSGQIHG